jgi:tetratricopeptide (TPR) repeat protein
MAVLILTIATALGRVYLLASASRELNSDDPAALALIRAQDALASAELILSFLEGGSVLLALALGAAALYGYRSTQDLRRDLKEELDRFEALRNEISSYREDLQKLSRLDKMEQEQKQEVRALLKNFNDLLRASEEVNLGNAPLAYKHLEKVFHRDKERGEATPNLQALYLAGALELQFVPSPDHGEAKLRQALSQDPDSSSIQGALGVALRRQALKPKANPAERNRLFHEALGYLLSALKQNFYLVDLQNESFWGPVAGTYRDMGNIPEAIGAYENARKVTPFSSYPMGNLYPLYLQTHEVDKAKLMAEETIRLAERELEKEPTAYYPRMDIAMAHTAFLHEGGPAEEKWARQKLQDALDVGPTAANVRVTLGGWQRLLGAYPKAWTEAIAYTKAVIAELEALLAQKEADEAQGGD